MKTFRSHREKQGKSYMNIEGKFSGDRTVQSRGAPVPNTAETKVEALE